MSPSHEFLGYTGNPEDDDDYLRSEFFRVEEEGGRPILIPRKEEYYSSISDLILPDNPTLTQMQAYELTKRLAFLSPFFVVHLYLMLEKLDNETISQLFHILDEATVNLLRKCVNSFSKLSATSLQATLSDGTFVQLSEVCYDIAHTSEAENQTSTLKKPFTMEDISIIFDYLELVKETHLSQPDALTLVVLTKIQANPHLTEWLRAFFAEDTVNEDMFVRFREKYPQNLPLLEQWQLTLVFTLFTKSEHALAIANHPQLEKIMELMTYEIFYEVWETVSMLAAQKTGVEMQRCRKQVLTILLDNPNLILFIRDCIPLFSETNNQFNESLSTLPWAKRLHLIYQFGEALGLAGATENELTAVIMYRHYCDKTGTPDQAKIDAFVEMEPAERWQEITKVRSQFDLTTVRPYIAYIRDNPHQVAIFAEQLDIPVGVGHDPSPLPGILTPEFLAQFDDFDNQPHLDHLRTKIGFEREYRLPAELDQLSRFVILPVLHKLGVRRGGGGGGGVLESSPGPFISHETAQAVYTLWNNLNFHVPAMLNTENSQEGWINIDSFHMTHQNYSQALSIMTSFAIALTGDVRAAVEPNTSKHDTSPIFHDSKGEGDYFEDKQPNDISSIRTRQALHRLHCLSAAQLAYELVILETEPYISYNPRMLLQDGGEILQAIADKLNFPPPPYSDNPNKINIIELPTQSIDASALTIDQKKLAHIYSSFVQALREGLRQVTIIRYIPEYISLTVDLEAVLSYYLTKEKTDALKKILKTVFPTLADYHNLEQVFTVQMPEAEVKYNGVLYPNPLAFVETLVADTVQEIEAVFHEADAAFLAQLFAVKAALANYDQVMSESDSQETISLREQRQNELHAELVQLYIRFPCGILEPPSQNSQMFFEVIERTRYLIDLYLPDNKTRSS